MTMSVEAITQESEMDAKMITLAVNWNRPDVVETLLSGFEGPPPYTVLQAGFQRALQLKRTEIIRLL